MNSPYKTDNHAQNGNGKSRRERRLPERYRIHGLVPIVPNESNVSSSLNSKSEVLDSMKVNKASDCAWLLCLFVA